MEGFAEHVEDSSKHQPSFMQWDWSEAMEEVSN